MDSNQYDVFFWLNVIANVLQVENYNLSVKDATNTDILKELQRQNSEFLSKIISQNELLIKQNKEILKKLNSD